MGGFSYATFSLPVNKVTAINSVSNLVFQRLTIFPIFSNQTPIYPMKHVFTFLFLLITSVSLQAQIVFDGSPGTNAPPATLGGYTMA
jgi:hypothetical protein